MMTPEQYNSLVDQFDQRKGENPLDGPHSEAADGQREWELLELAVDAIQLHAITEQVRNGRMKFELEQHELERSQAENGSALSSDASPMAAVPIGKMADMVAAGHRATSVPPAVPVIRRRMSPVLQIAAALIVVVVSAGVIKVANTRPEGVFDQNYSDYQLSVTRGADVSDALEQAYRGRNWAAVYSTFAATHAKTQKDYFLTAMAHMQQKEYYEAISLLKTLIGYNQGKEPYFEDEAEYYLAMNYLATGQAAPAVELFDKIKSDPRHVYHSRVEEMGKLDLGILRIK
jgi:tetratricopeptide (TPR) repeat protein